MEINMRKYEAVVKEGIEFLDWFMPKWICCIDLHTLKMDHPNFCILGQLFGSSFRGKAVILKYLDNFENHQWSYDHGFSLTGYHIKIKRTDYTILTKEWKKQIRAHTYEE